MYEIPENSEIPEIQKKRQIQQDDIEEIPEKENQDTNEDAVKEKFDLFFLDFSKLLRLIEFQGDILKNYATKIQNQPRKDIIELMGRSNLKLIGFLCNYVSSEINKIIEIVEKKEKNENKEKGLGKEKFLNLINDYVSILWSGFIELNVSNLAACWECDSIQADIADYKEKMQSAFLDMVYIEYKIRITDSKLPVLDIEKCLSGKSKLDSFTNEIMKNIVATYLVSYQYDSKDKKRVCELLNLNYKALFIEDQKNAILELE